ncbi:MAG: sugar O-acetyltransferase [Lachnospiraceae bacterium]|nr:sugar O-acetyltransferase [Lachnospiraceae bacterium]
MTELEKQKSLEEYWNNDPEIVEAKKRARMITQMINQTPAEDTGKIFDIACELFGSCGKGLYIKPPFYCDFGYNIHVGENCIINFQCVLLDEAPIIIGDNCMIGPMTGLYTVSHPLDPERRAAGYVSGKPIVLENNVWIGGSCTILPGVTIGENAVIGAGAVVTKDIPANTVAAGNPAKVLRKL